MAILQEIPDMLTHRQSDHRAHHVRKRDTIYILSGCIMIFPGLIFLMFACLREDPMFWTHRGGYPVLLRDLVYFMFYPLGFLFGWYVIMLTFAFMTSVRRPYVMIWSKLTLLLTCWAIFAGSLAIAWANNFKNFLENRPIKYHAPFHEGSAKKVGYTVDFSLVKP
jgi:hypothetical protein